MVENERFLTQNKNSLLLCFLHEGTLPQRILRDGDASTDNITVHSPAQFKLSTRSRPYHPVATSKILKKMTDPNLPTMRTCINGLALTLAEKTWAQKELTAYPDLASTWTPETDTRPC
ncbi:hypothetical protein PROFUN_09729 [Planoprotostelium fungivorum]|uniref:Uncharacterized protein n=1 Tax=Planoprotostelium fungivorum TaxID=1890364 RepID=A0A2P6NEX4_9EUKA|nr:hypothetical protein PROFUN_09729 [Planoprotostelium fungivorum]